MINKKSDEISKYSWTKDISCFIYYLFYFYIYYKKFLFEVLLTDIIL